jgi:hypothetical protein
MKTLKVQLEERLNSIEQAYEETGLPKLDFSMYPESMQEHEEASYDAKVIVEAARKIERENGSGEIDWADGSQRKWYPWFYMNPSGFRFGGSDFDHGYASAGGGSRLRVLTEEASDHIGKTFLGVWEKVQLK